MMKKNTVVLFLILAYAILLGHNIIPHHHYHADHDLTEHHHTDHHDDSDGDEDSDDFNHLFSHFIHSADGFTIANNHKRTNTFAKQWILIVAVLPNNFSFGSYTIPPLLDKPPARHLSYISPHSLSSDLRAPPAFIA